MSEERGRSVGVGVAGTLPPESPRRGHEWDPVRRVSVSALPFPAPIGQTPQWPVTIGVALPIPEPFLGELGAYRERFGDPLAHAIVAHITLVPPTEIGDQDHLDRVVAHLQAVSAKLEPFPIVLAGAGSFRPVSPVVFVPLEQGEKHVREVESLVRTGPLWRELNFPFHPHVTVAHDVSPQWLDQAEETMAGYRAAFEVGQLALFENGADGVWRQTEAYPFGARGSLPA